MNVILDIDGVMVHAISNKSVEFESDGFYKFNYEAVEALNYIFSLYEIEYNNIILSTTHRLKYSEADWQMMLRTRGLRRVSSISRLPEYESNNKLDIIKSIIDNDGLSIAESIIIDDDKSLNNLPEELKTRLILTSPITGLLMDDVLNFYKGN